MIWRISHTVDTDIEEFIVFADLDLIFVDAPNLHEFWMIQGLLQSSSFDIPISLRKRGVFFDFSVHLYKNLMMETIIKMLRFEKKNETLQQKWASSITP
ncbi:MAG: hypothetical protein ACMUEM_04200 [Flavobacteriales bacterium AspAUS03]